MGCGLPLLVDWVVAAQTVVADGACGYEDSWGMDEASTQVHQGACRPDSAVDELLAARFCPGKTQNARAGQIYHDFDVLVVGQFRSRQ